jgi:hypothetical protein
MRTPDLHWRALAFFVERAVCAHEDPRVREVMFRQLIGGAYRIMADVHLDHDDVPDPDTLTYHVDLAVSDGGFERLCSVDARLLPVSDADRADEIRLLLAQHGIGIPDDASSLTP